MVSSTSSSAYPALLPGSTRLAGSPRSSMCPTSATRNRVATASSWRTWPKVNARRNDPHVDGAYARAKTRLIPPCRSSVMSSMLSAPATMPATSEATFNPELAPLSLGTVKCSSARSRRPADSANASAGTSPADDTRFGSSNTADVAPSV